MKILLISQYFYPEQFKCNDVAVELVRRGHEVNVLTGIPNYPQGKFFSGYGLFRKRYECIGGVKVHRVWLIPRGKGGALRLALNYFSFALFASFKVLCFACRQRFDAVLVHETSPVTVGIPAVVLKKLRGTPIYFWVLDLWPESLEAAGGVSNKYVLGFFAGITRWIYRNSDRILISSRGFRRSVTEKGVAEEKLIYFPNWADRALELEREYELPPMPDGFRIMFAGNIGEAQDFDHIMQAALALKKEQRIRFLLVGDGRKRAWVERFIRDHELQDTVHYLGRHPLTSMPAFFASADVLLVSLKDELIFNLTAPAKIQAYMSAGRPILAMMNGEGARLVHDAGCGIAVPAGDAESLARAILKFSRMSGSDLEHLGENGRRYCNTHFALDKCMDNLEKILQAALKA